VRILSRFRGVTIDRVWIGELDLLTTCIHHSELHLITAPLLISTIHRSPHHSLSLFQPAVSSTAVPSRRLLTVEILQLPALMSLLSGEYPATELLSTVNLTIAPSLLSLPCRARLNCQPPRLLFTDWLSTDNWQLNFLTHQPTTSLHFTRLNYWQLNWSICLQDNSSARTT
jgi:hypothetical protein